MSILVHNYIPLLFIVYKITVAVVGWCDVTTDKAQCRVADDAMSFFGQYSAQCYSTTVFEVNSLSN